MKEGELRYRYKLPPGYEDATKDGIDKFGDLIFWKQILNKSSNIENKYIILVTSDVKPDWFQKNKKNEVVSPREELLSEFNQLHTEKEMIIIPFEDFIEEISDVSDPSDRDLLLELRTNNLIKRLPQDLFEKMVEEKLS
ncbi:PIN-like domain-containing protein [Bacillus atrophaeus]|uniref:PIN-like domain-containing protein n=1 Tax=Bacillus atrophaeus TaxID=1452 RepID=UPI002280A083|nr:PIN-like domain-containing protein [Bacillus atrophaeus]MCY9160064.1 PIN-like domain-containing protein [Bacillus atrophaeus]